jgi:ribosomal protein S27E
MSLVRCPHCGAENFTIESWEDLDRCSSCGKPLGEPEGTPVDAGGRGPSVGEVQPAPVKGAAQRKPRSA